MKNTPVSIREIESYFWRELLRDRFRFVGSLLIIPATILRTVLSPLFIAHAFSELAKGRPLNSSYLLSALGALALGIVLEHFATVCETEMNIRKNERLYQRCFDWLTRQDYGFYTDEFVGSLVALSNRFVKASEFHSFIYFLQVMGLLSSVVVALVVMTYYSPVVGLVAVVLWAGSVCIAAYLTVQRIPTRREAVMADSVQTGALADALTNVVAIKTFAAEAIETHRYEHANAQRADKYRRSWALSIRNGTAVRILAAILQMTVFAGGALAIQNHTITLATFLLFQVYAIIIINSIFEIQMIVRNLEGIYGDATEMMELFSLKQRVTNQSNPEPSQISKGAIVFDSVNFSYDEGALFEHFNVAVKAGEKIGLVGLSGGGKTTITKLLLRFSDVEAGSITIDGQDIRRIHQDDLHRAISYVPQDPLLFHRSLQENIAYGNSDANHTEIKRAARLAHAAEFIDALPNGYDTLVGERGIKLSGGQRQRIALARAILKKSPILVLDEPTSALDSETEGYVQEALWQLMEGKTAVVIAHRLSTIKHLDRILVLDKGTIIEQGTHDELLSQKGTYARLWEHQSDGFM